MKQFQPGAASRKRSSVHADECVWQTVNFDYEIAQGPRVYVKCIEIHGNKMTQDEIIRGNMWAGDIEILAAWWRLAFNASKCSLSNCTDQRLTNDMRRRNENERRQT